jgi:hypothetical protein
MDSLEYMCFRTAKPFNETANDLGRPEMPLVIRNTFLENLVEEMEEQSCPNSGVMDSPLITSLPSPRCQASATLRKSFLATEPLKEIVMDVALSTPLLAPRCLASATALPKCFYAEPIDQIGAEPCRRPEFFQGGWTAGKSDISWCPGEQCTCLEDNSMAELTPAPAARSGLQIMSTASGTFQITWHVNAHKLKSMSRNMVSPFFAMPFGSNSADADFKLMISATCTSTSWGGSTFKRSKGRGVIQLKCEDTLPQDTYICCWMSVGQDEIQSEKRGPVKHNFAETATCSLPRGQEEWNFQEYARDGSVTVRVEVKTAGDEV